MDIDETTLRALGAKQDASEQSWELTSGSHKFWLHQPWALSDRWVLVVGGSTSYHTREQREVKTVADCLRVVVLCMVETGRGELRCELRQLLGVR